MQHHYETVCATGEASKRQGTMAETEDVITGKQYGKYSYTCVHCVAKRDSITVMDAIQQIKKPKTDKHIARGKAFELALKQVQQTFKFLYIDTDATASAASASAPGVEALSKKKAKKKMRQMATVKIQTMKEVFAPMAQILALKMKDMNLAAMAVQRLQRHLKGEPLADIDEDLGLLEKLEDEVNKHTYKERGSRATSNNN